VYWEQISDAYGGGLTHQRNARLATRPGRQCVGRFGRRLRYPAETLTPLGYRTLLARLPKYRPGLQQTVGMSKSDEDSAPDFNAAMVASGLGTIAIVGAAALHVSLISDGSGHWYDFVWILVLLSLAGIGARTFIRARRRAKTQTIR